MTALKPMVAEKCTGTRNILSHLFVYAVVLIAILPQITVIVTSFLARRRNRIHRRLFPGKLQEHPRYSKNNNTAIFNHLTCSEYAPLPLWWCSVSSYPT